MSLQQLKDHPFQPNLNLKQVMQSGHIDVPWL